jgi:hypothetical protein
MPSQSVDALFIKQERRIHRHFHQGRPDKVAGKNINPAEVTIFSIMSKYIIVLDAKTTTDEALQKLQKNHSPIRPNPE